MKRVYLEITNSCNLNCNFCTNPKGNNFLSFDNIKNYILQIKKYCNYIYLHILGEPLLHPDFEKILDFLDENSMNLQLVTNGTLLYKYPNLLNHSCLRKLSISIHSINNVNVGETYFEYINKLIDNNKVNIELRFYNSDSLSDRLINYLTSLKKRYSFIETNKKNSYKLKDNVYIYFEDFFKWPSISDEIINNIGTCHGGIDMIAINSSSKVSICCLDPYAHNYIGDLSKQKLDDILSSQLYLQYINDFKNHRISSELCKRCSYRLRFR